MKTFKQFITEGKKKQKKQQKEEQKAAKAAQKEHNKRIKELQSRVTPELMAQRIPHRTSGPNGGTITFPSSAPNSVDRMADINRMMKIDSVWRAQQRAIMAPNNTPEKKQKKK